MGFDTITLVVTCTDCTSSCKSNYYTITTTTITKSTSVVQWFICSLVCGKSCGSIQFLFQPNTVKIIRGWSFAEDAELRSKNNDGLGDVELHVYMRIVDWHFFNLFSSWHNYSIAHLKLSQITHITCSFYHKCVVY